MVDNGYSNVSLVAMDLPSNMAWIWMMADAELDEQGQDLWKSWVLSIDRNVDLDKRFVPGEPRSSVGKEFLSIHVEAEYLKDRTMNWTNSTESSKNNTFY